MKKTLKLLIIMLLPLLGICQNSIAQTNIEKLSIKKGSLTKQIKVLQDSLVKVNQEILNIQEANISKDINRRSNSILLGEIIQPFAIMYSEPNEKSLVIDSIPKGTKVEIMDVDGFLETCIKTKYNTKIGFIFTNDIISTKQFARFRDSLKVVKQREYVVMKEGKAKKQSKENLNKAKEAEYKAQEKAQQDYKAREKRLNQEYGNTIASKILNREIWIGMSKEIAIESLGKPRIVNKTVTPNRVTEQWVYNTKNLYFEGNILTSWQESH